MMTSLFPLGMHYDQNSYSELTVALRRSTSFQSSVRGDCEVPVWSQYMSLYQVPPLPTLCIQSSSNAVPQVSRTFPDPGALYRPLLHIKWHCFSLTHLEISYLFASLAHTQPFCKTSPLPMNAQWYSG